MPRKKLIRTSKYPYHITARSNNRDWFYIPIGDVYGYSCEHLNKAKERYNIDVHIFVLMSNHYHMVVNTPESNIDSFMQFFNQALGKSISKQAKRINRIFGAPYKWNLITTDSYYLNVVRYVYQNPLRANIIETIEEYPYMHFDSLSVNDELRDWLDNPVSQYENDNTRRVLRRYRI